MFGRERVKGRFPRIQIVKQTRESPDHGIHYTGFYNQTLDIGDPVVQRMAFFARRIGAGLSLTVGDLKFGFKAKVGLGNLTEDEAKEFPATFVPDWAAEIPSL